MRQIVIDNWTLERAAVSIHNTYERLSTPNSEYASLIEALILWEEILFFENEKSCFWQNILWRFNYEKFIRPIDIPRLTQSQLALPINNGIIEKGALEYFERCRCLGIDYLVVQERADFLSKHIKHLDTLNRSAIMNRVDSKLEKFYQEVNEQIGKPYFRFQFPALFDFVRNNTSDSKFFIETALQLRNSEMVKKFHQWLCAFEAAGTSGNAREVALLIKDVDRLFSDLKISVKAGEVIIGIPPSVPILIENFPHLRRNWNLTFLKKVITESKRNRPVDKN